MDVQIGFNMTISEALLVFVHSISECSSGSIALDPEQLSSIHTCCDDTNDPPRMRLTICDPAADKVLFTSSKLTTDDSSQATFNIPNLMSQFRSNVDSLKMSVHRNYPQCFTTMYSIDAIRSLNQDFETRTVLIGFGGLAFVLEHKTVVAATQPRINTSRDTLPKSSTSLSPPISPVDAPGGSKVGKRSSRPWEVEDESDGPSDLLSHPDNLNGPVLKRNSIPSISDMLPSIHTPMLSNWNGSTENRAIHPQEYLGSDIRGGQVWPSTATASHPPAFVPSFPSTTQPTFERRLSTYLETQPQVPSPSTTPQSIVLRPQVSSSHPQHYNSRLHMHQPQPQRQQVHYIIQQLNSTSDAAASSPHKPIQLPPHFHSVQTQPSISPNATFPPPQPQAPQSKFQVIDSKSPSPNRDDDEGSGNPVSVGKPRPLKDGECKKCGVTSSREWRKGPHGAKT
ncbi:hypothetical protein HDU81_000259, partial [Chytriomyces hyalinus]